MNAHEVHTYIHHTFYIFTFHVGKVLLNKKIGCRLRVSLQSITRMVITFTLADDCGCACDSSSESGAFESWTGAPARHAKSCVRWADKNARLQQ